MKWSWPGASRFGSRMNRWVVALAFPLRARFRAVDVTNHLLTLVCCHAACPHAQLLRLPCGAASGEDLAASRVFLGSLDRAAVATQWPRQWHDEFDDDDTSDVVHVFAVDIGGKATSGGSGDDTSVHAVLAALEDTVQQDGGTVRTRHLRSAVLGSSVSNAEAAVLGRACSLLHWHRGAKYCSTCGGATAASATGDHRTCPACGKQVFPRVDPIAISTVTAGTGDDLHLLLGRQRHFPPGVYSALAGFIEVCVPGVCRSGFASTAP